MPAAGRGRRVLGGLDTDDIGGESRVERWFHRVMLGVSAVAWLALLLAELGQFRVALLWLLLATGAFGLSLLGYAFRTSLSRAAG